MIPCDLRLLTRSALDDPEDLQAMVKETACRRISGCVVDSKLDVVAVAVILNTRAALDKTEIHDGDDSFAAK